MGSRYTLAGFLTFDILLWLLVMSILTPIVTTIFIQTHQFVTACISQTYQQSDRHIIARYLRLDMLSGTLHSLPHGVRIESPHQDAIVYRQKNNRLQRIAQNTQYLTQRPLVKTVLKDPTYPECIHIVFIHMPSLHACIAIGP